MAHLPDVKSQVLAALEANVWLRELGVPVAGIVDRMPEDICRSIVNKDPSLSPVSLREYFPDGFTVSQLTTVFNDLRSEIQTPGSTRPSSAASSAPFNTEAMFQD